MYSEYLMLFVILALGIAGHNTTVAYAVIIVLVLKLLGLTAMLDILSVNGLNWGIVLLLAAILVPIATGDVTIANMIDAFKSPLGVAAIVCGGIIFYLCYRAEGNWGFVLPYRGQKLLAMLLVGSAIASATMVFQTLTANRILTPSIIGLDALYLLSKMLVIFLAGTTAAQAARPPLWQFYLDTALMTAAAAALFATFLPLLARDIYRLLLIGIIFGVLCSKLTDLMARMLDPAAYTSFQAVAYARFDRARADLILPAAFIIGACLAWIWYKRHTLDILALGREQAINLGVAYPRELLTLMLTVSLLVAVSTALVGPTLFFGLLVSALACRLFPVPYHAIQLPAACLLACAILIIGQTLFERVFHFAATLSILIECIGGSVFLYLLLARKQP